MLRRGDELAQKDGEFADFVDVEEKRWRRAWTDEDGVPTKIDKYGDGEWKTISGDGEVAGIVAKIFRKSLNVDFAAKVQKYGEFELWEEVSVTVRYKTTFTSRWDYDTEILKIGSPTPTGNTDWRPNGSVTGRRLVDVQMCAISCDGMGL